MSLPLRNLALATALILLMTAGAASVSAQPASRGGGWAGMDRPDPERMEQRGQKIFDRMCEFLELDESQREQFKKLSDEHHGNLRSLRDRIKDESLEREAAHELLDGERKRFRESLTGVLSEEQLEKLDRRHKERPRLERGRGPGMHPGMHDRPGMEGPGAGMRPGRPGKFGPMGGVLFGLRDRLDLTDEQVKQLHLLTGEAIEGMFDKFSATLDLEQQEKLKNMRERIKEHRDMHRGDPPGE